MNKTLLVLLCLLAPLFARADLVVVASAKSPVTSLTAEEVRQLFLGRGGSRRDASLAAVDLPSGNAVRDQFYQQLSNRNAQQMNAYWARMIFTGRGNPPLEVGSLNDLGRRLQQQPELVGYMPRDKVPEGLQILLTVE